MKACFWNKQWGGLYVYVSVIVLTLIFLCQSFEVKADKVIDIPDFTYGYNVVKYDVNNQLLDEPQRLQLKQDVPFKFGDSNDTKVIVNNTLLAKGYDLHNISWETFKLNRWHTPYYAVDSLAPMVSNPNNPGAYEIYFKSPKNNMQYLRDFHADLDITVKYSYIGTYDGKPIGAEMKIKSITFAEQVKNEDLLLVISHNFYFGFWCKVMRDGFQDERNPPIDMEYTLKFIDQNGNYITDIDNSYLTFNSLNNHEHAGYKHHGNSTNGITAYVSSDTLLGQSYGDTEEMFGFIGGVWNLNYSDYAMEGLSDDFTDEIGDATFYKAAVTFALTDISHSIFFSGKGWTSFSTALPIPYAARPTKTLTVNTGPNANKTYDDTAGRIYQGQLLTYNINQPMATSGTQTLSSYNSMQFVDTIPQGLTVDVDKIKLVDSKGNTYDIKQNGLLSFDQATNKVTYTLYNGSDKLLRNKSIYDGRTLTLQIPVTVDKFKVDKKRSYNNTAHVIINTKDRQTNNIYAWATGVTADKPIKTVDKTHALPNDLLTYTVSQKLTMAVACDSLVMSDTLDSNLNYQGLEVYLDDKLVDADDYNVTYDTKKHKLEVNFTHDYLQKLDYNGQTLKFKIKAIVDKGAVYKTQIQNSADVAIDDINQTTNQVSTIIDLINNSIVKSFNQTIDSNGYASFDSTKDSTLKYQIMARFGNGARYSNATISDNLEVVMDKGITSDISYAIYDINNKLQGSGTVEVNGSAMSVGLDKSQNAINTTYDARTRLFKFNLSRTLHYATDKPLNNYYVVLTFDVGISANQMYGDYYDAKTNTIKVPNRALLKTLNDNNSVQSNTIYAKTTPIAPTLSKKIVYTNNKESITTPVKYNDKFKYKISGNTGNYTIFSPEMHLADSLPVGQSVDVDSQSIKINGEKIDDEYLQYFEGENDNQNINSVLAIFHNGHDNVIASKLSKISTIEWTYDVLIKDDYEALQPYAKTDLNVNSQAKWYSSSWSMDIGFDGDLVATSNQVSAKIAPMVEIGADMSIVTNSNSHVVGGIGWFAKALLTSDKGSALTGFIDFENLKTAVDFSGNTNAFNIDEQATLKGKTIKNGETLHGIVKLNYDGAKMSDNDSTFDIFSCYVNSQPNAIDTKYYAYNDNTTKRYSVRYNIGTLNRYNANKTTDKTKKSIVGQVLRTPQVIARYYIHNNDSSGVATSFEQKYYATSSVKFNMSDSDLSNKDSLQNTSAKSGYDINLYYQYTMSYWYSEYLDDYYNNWVNVKGTNNKFDNFGTFFTNPNNVALIKGANSNLSDLFNDVADKDVVMKNYQSNVYTNNNDIRSKLKSVYSKDNNNYTLDDLNGYHIATTHVDPNLSGKLRVDTYNYCYGIYGNNSLMFPKQNKLIVQRYKLPDNMSTLKDFIKNGTYNLNIVAKTSVNNGTKLHNWYVSDAFRGNTPLSNYILNSQTIMFPLEIYGHRFITKQDGFSNDTQDEINIQPSTSGLQKDDSTTLGEFIDNNEVE